MESARCCLVKELHVSVNFTTVSFYSNVRDGRTKTKLQYDSIFVDLKCNPVNLNCRDRIAVLALISCRVHHHCPWCLCR